MNNNANSNWLIQVVIIILSFILGGTGLTIANGVTSNPIVTILIMIVFSVAPIIAGLANGVWKNLEPDFIVGMSTSIRGWFQKREDAKFRQPYLRHLINKYRAFDLKGLPITSPFSVMLDEIFIELRVNVGESKLGNPVPPELKEGGHSIWQYLSNETMMHFAIIGAAGSGKTTLLKHVILTLAQPNRSTLNLNNIPKLPILLFLRDHAEAIADNPSIKISDLILSTLEALPEKPPVNFFDEQLKQKSCLIMLDGLDEVSEQHRKKVIDWVEVQMSAFGDNCFIITSRPSGYKNNPLNGITQLDALPLNREQVKKFVHKWYSAVKIRELDKDKPDVVWDAEEKAKDLLKSVYSSNDLIELTVNPLLLIMITYVHHLGVGLPKTRAELYDKIIKSFLKLRNETKNIPMMLTFEQKLSVLQPLAYEMMLIEKRGLPEAEILTLINVILKKLKGMPDDLTPKMFIQYIYEDSAILIEREYEFWEFSHRTFQEYLTATYIKEVNLEAELIERIDEVWWHETIRLYCGREDATAIIEACITVQPTPITRLVLAIECMEEARHLSLETRQKLTQIIEEDIESNDIKRFKVAAEAKLAVRLNRLSSYNNYIKIDTIPISLAEYQLFLDEHPNYKPIHWDEDYPRQKKKDTLIGVSSFGAKKFCAWLTTRDVSGEWVYRLPRTQEISNKAVYWGTQEGNICLIGQSALDYPFDRWLINYVGNMDVFPAMLLSQSVSLTQQDSELRYLKTYIQGGIQIIYTRTLNLDLNHALNLDLNHARDLDRVVNLARDLIHDIDFTLSHDNTLDIDRALAHVLDRALALDQAIALNHALSQALDPALVSGLERDLERAFEHAFDLGRGRARAIDRVINRERDRDRNFDPDRDIDRALNRALALTRTLALALDHTLGIEISHALAAALERDREQNRITKRQLLNEVTQLAKLINLILIDVMFFFILQDTGEACIPINFVEKCEIMGKYIQDLYAKQPQKARIGNNEKWQNWRDELTKYMEAYAYMAMMERRRRGEWQPTETLWIVRERRKHEDR